MLPSLEPDFLLYEFLSGMNSPDALGQTPVKRPNLLFPRRLARGWLTTLGVRQDEVQALPAPGTVWCHGTTRNQLEVLQPVASALRSKAHIWDLFNLCASWLAITGQPFEPAHGEAEARLPAHTPPALAALYAAALAEARLLQSTLLRGRPAAVLTTNDHSPRHMALRYAARETETPLIYLQHAAVGGVEPPLEGFAMALLYGEHFADLYRKAGPLPEQSWLVGSPKLDADQKAAVRHESRLTVGVCPGLSADPQRTAVVIGAIRDVLPAGADIRLRRHPRDERHAAWRPVFDLLGSRPDSEVVSTRDFLLSCKLIVADDSNIAIEALGLSCHAIRTPFGPHLGDQYRIADTPYFRDWTVDEEGLPRALRTALAETAPPPAEMARPFFHTAGTAWHGRSAELISTIIGQAYLGSDAGADLTLYRLDRA